MPFVKASEHSNEEVLTKLEVRGDLAIYTCPKCGQRLEMGLHGNETFSISYPGRPSISKEEKLDHNHIYPTYLDVDYFSKKGMPIPAIEFSGLFKSMRQQLRQDLDQL